MRHGYQMVFGALSFANGVWTRHDTPLHGSHHAGAIGGYAQGDA